jgi:hypothetical protein
MLAPMPTATTATWPIPGDAPDLRAIVEAQATTIADQAALLHAYQANLAAVQNPAPGTAATGTGTATGSNQLTVAAPITGSIVAGAAIAGTGVPAATTILGQISGTAGAAGVYLTSAALTIAGVALTFTPPPPASTWPTPTDAPTLMLIVQDQTTILRQQAALLQAYQSLLNDSETPAPPSGP